jgi:SAM-dependent methyltransferase
MTAYRSLADVYEWLTPVELLTPEGSVAPFAPWIEGAVRVLDCACGIGLLAAGLAQRGLEVHATDASPQMVRRTRATAERFGVVVDARVCAWEDLPPSGDFDVVFCIGNALPHARDRVAALRGMAGALRPGGLLLVTSRNWELEQPSGRSEVERDGRRALVTYDWLEGGQVEITVAFDRGSVSERLTFHPFPQEALLDDLRAAGLEPADSTFERHVERYLVSAHRPRG